MARGYWIRWGRGSCVGYGLEIGYGQFSFRADVVRNVLGSTSSPHTWRASVNGCSVGHDLIDEAAAKAAVEFELRIAMQHVLEDWNAYQARRGLERIGVR